MKTTSFVESQKNNDLPNINEMFFQVFSQGNTEEKNTETYTSCSVDMLSAEL